MNDQHRKNLSEAMKKWWARRGGLSTEQRQQISMSIKSASARKRESGANQSIPPAQSPPDQPTATPGFVVEHC
jgi:hypothetical protein